MNSSTHDKTPSSDEPPAPDVREQAVKPWLYWLAPDVREQVIEAGKQGITLLKLGRVEEAIAISNDIAQLSGNTVEPHADYAYWLFLKGCGAFDEEDLNDEEAIAIFDEIFLRFGDDDSLGHERVALILTEVLSAKSHILERQGKHEEAVALFADAMRHFDEVVQRLVNDDSSYARRIVAKALVAKSEILMIHPTCVESSPDLHSNYAYWFLLKSDVLNDGVSDIIGGIIQRFGVDDSFGRGITEVLSAKSHILKQQGKHEDAYTLLANAARLLDKVVQCLFSSDDSFYTRRIVIMTLLTKSEILGMLGKYEEANTINKKAVRLHEELERKHKYSDSSVQSKLEILREALERKYFVAPRK